MANIEEGRSAFKLLTDTHTGKRPLGRPRRRWKDNLREECRLKQDPEANIWAQKGCKWRLEKASQ